MRTSTRAALAVLLATAATTGVARAEWMQADATWRDAQLLLRGAARDTAGRADDPARLDTLAVALLRVGRTAEAEALFRRVLAMAPGDPAAMASLGKLALFANRLDTADSLLVPARGVEGALADLYASRLRRRDWLATAKLAEAVGDPGRTELLAHLASPELEPNERVPDGPGAPAITVLSGPERAVVRLERTWPVPLVKAKLNGRPVLMAVDVGVADCLLDESVARVCDVKTLASQYAVLWNGGRQAVTAAWIRDLEVGGMRVATVPAGVLALRRYSLSVNPQAPTVAGVIGVNVLRRFGFALDWRRGELELVRSGAAPASGAAAVRVPFQWWGESELMVQGTLNGGRRMWLMLGTGLPGGVGASQDVFDEIGVRPGSVSKALRSANAVLQSHPWAQVGVPVATVGAVAASKLTGWSGAFAATELWRHGVRRDALLGPEVWRRRRVVFDWQASELRVEGSE